MQRKIVLIIAIFLLTIMLVGCNSDDNKIAKESEVSKGLPKIFAPIKRPSAMTGFNALSLPVIPSDEDKDFEFMTMTTIASAEVNTNFDTIFSYVDDIRAFLVDLLTHIVDLIGTNTFTGANTFTNTTTFTTSSSGGTGQVRIHSSLTLLSSSGAGTFNDSSFTLDNDNTGAEATRLCFSGNRGSTSANDPSLCYEGGSTIWKVCQDATCSTLSQVEIAAGSSANHATRYDQVGKLSTANEWTMLQNFDVAPTSDVAASGSTELTRLGEVTSAISAVATGGATGGSGAPVGSCTAGAIYYDYATSTAPIEYYCRGADSMTWVKVNQDVINSAITINGNVTQAADFTVSGTRTLDAGANKWTNLADPSSLQDAVTVNYFNTNSQWIPLYLDSLTAWVEGYKETDGVDGMTLTTWSDFSGNSYDFMESTNPPTFESTGINSLPALQFDGTNDILKTSTNLSNLISTTDYTSFLVFRTPSSFQAGGSLCSQSNVVSILSPESSATCRYGLFLDNAGALKAINYDGSQDAVTAATTLTTSTNYIVTFRHTGGNLYIQVNNDSEQSTASGTTDTLADVLILGATNGGAGFADVDIAHYSTTNTALTASQIAKYKNFLNGKYAAY